MPYSRSNMRGWKDDVAARFGAAHHSYDAFAHVQAAVAGQLIDLCPVLEQDSPRILEVGCGTGALTKGLFARYADADFVLSDISADMISHAKGALDALDVCAQWCVMDGENPHAVLGDQRFDLIIANMCVQWFEDSARGLARLASYLKPGGDVLYSMPGPKTFHQWRAAAQDCGLEDGLLVFADQGDFVCAREVIEAQFESGLDFLKQMKLIGAHTPRADYVPLSVADLRRVCRVFEDRFDAQADWDVQYCRIKAAL